MSEPLSSLLSQTLVALTVEVDNEYEGRAPYFTTDYRVGPNGPGPWLCSLAMYVQFLRFVPDGGIVMRDLSAASGSIDPIHPSYHGMRRWGYATYTPDIAGSSPKKKDADALVRLTPAGARARELWQQALDDVERRWSERGLASLQRALLPVVSSIDRALPEYVPIMGFDWRLPSIGEPVRREPGELGLVALVAQALLEITIEFDAESPYALCVCQNVLRTLGEDAVLVRDLPEVTGLAKKAWDNGVPLAARLGVWAEEKNASGRGKSVRLTDSGLVAKERFPVLLRDVEQRWAERCHPLAALRAELEAFVGDGRPGAPVFAGIEPYPDGWRSKVAPIRALPHHPLVSHRGGYPDGS